jgi:hypothetical protein
MNAPLDARRIGEVDPFHVVQRRPRDGRSIIVTALR